MRFFDESAGESVEIPDTPRRIVSLAPDITDAVFRLVPATRVAGVSLYCIRPRNSKLNGILRVGSYLKIIDKRLKAAHPDLILTTLGAQRTITDQLRSQGYPVFSVPVPINMWGILDNFMRIAAVVNAKDVAFDYAAKLHDQMSALKGCLSPRRVYWEVDLGGPITAGRNTYVHHALQWIGLTNVYGDVRDSYFQPVDEETRTRKPQWILYEPKKDYDRTGQKRLLAKLQRRWGNIPILILPHDFLAHYGPALVDEVLPKLTKLME